MEVREAGKAICVSGLKDPNTLLPAEDLMVVRTGDLGQARELGEGQEAADLIRLAIVWRERGGGSCQGVI